MLRTAVLIFGCLVLALGAYLCTKGTAFGGVQTLIGGAVIVLATLFERWRYHNRNASDGADWQPTGERFVDPETGKNVEVLYDPQSGERRYRPIAGAQERI
jgi:hypothetical protein